MPKASFAESESTCLISGQNWDHALSAVLVLVVSHMSGRVSQKDSISKKPYVLIGDMFILETATSYFCTVRSALKKNRDLLW